MSAERCSELLTRGSIDSCVAIVAGSFAPAGQRCGGDLLVLARTLGLPRLLVVDLQEVFTAVLPADLEPTGIILSSQSCSVDSALLNRAIQYVERTLRIPVAGHYAPGKITWSANFQNQLLAAREGSEVCCRRATFLKCRERRRWPLRIAIAYDEAFSGYFPETLASLQACGATFLDFSPLRNDCLPKDADIVYLGDGPLGDWLPRIAANHCFLHRLCAFASRGGKIVAEGRGAVCLCREARPLSGGSIPLVGILPAIADETERTDFLPLQLSLEENSWLARQGTPFQGYAPAHWRITGDETDAGFVQPGRILTRGNVLALPFAQHWASRPDLIRSFFRARGRRMPDGAAV